MRLASLLLVAVLTLSGVGCHHNLAKNGCSSCQGCSSGNCGGYAGLGGNGIGRGGHHGHGHGGIGGALANHLGGPAPTPVARLPHGYEENMGPPGPPTATYGYPYYTTRAPRDFLMDNPPSIGP